MNKAAIGLGSNIDPVDNIARAKTALAEKFTVIGESDFIKTKPIGNQDQDDFINGAILVETDLSADQLDGTLKTIETGLGRKPGHDPNAPRTIDLDIVVWNNAVVDKDFYKRDFLKNAILELIPDLQY